MVAWRRGLLTPGYEQGMRSRIREAFVLSMVSDELTSEAYRDMASMTAALLSTHAAGRSMQDLYNSLCDRMEYVSYKREYSIRSLRGSQADMENFVEHAVETMRKLKEAGVVEMFDRKATEIHNRLTPQQSQE